MLKATLTKGWKMKECTAADYMDAVVPGSVYMDLMANGKMGDPFYRANEKEALEVISHDYEYRTVFDVAEEMLLSDIVYLHFDGIDTLSTVKLNGQLLGETDNMHRTWEFSVKELLKTKGNELQVILHSPTEYIAKSYAEKPIEGSTDSMRGFPRLRKAHCMFGWDWGPRIPDAGIFRKVFLLGVNKARFDSVYITQEHEPGKVTLNLQVKVELQEDEKEQIEQKGEEGRIRQTGKREQIDQAGEGERLGQTVGREQIEQENERKQTSENISWTYDVTITSPDGEVHTYSGSPEAISIQNPKLWWPNGYGDQPLYTVKVELSAYGEVLDVWERRIGLRTMTVSREKDQYGESFAHEINGIRIFGMGADYIPEDNLLGRVNRERTRKLLESARDAHFNVIRVWGGGYYPDDFFYDICDELGLIVWQDFMFACAVYDLTESFEESITAEFIDNIKRIRHHASLGLWCGNNEMELFLADDRDGWCKDPIQFSDYIKMFEYIIPKVLKTYDPQTFYWPASPSSGGGFDNPSDENRGDVHYWDVWHGGKPITEYRKFFFRYVSEFGFQSFPSLKTVETFTEPEDRNIFSYVMEKHQRNASANGKIMNYMGQTFLYPNDFDMTIYASQLLQAEAMRYGVEHFRRNRGRCMGAVIWQLNDCWPVASWATIDYFGRWKAVHYYAKRFFAPLMISCSEEGTLTQDPNVNAQPYEMRKSIALCACNETLEWKNVEITWELRDAGAKILKGGKYELTLEPLSSVWMEKVELPEADIYDNYVSYRMEQGGNICSQGTVLFCAPKHFRFRNPKLDVRIEGDELVVSSDCYAKSIRIINEEDTMRLEDNYFDLNGGSRRIKILEGNPVGLQVRSVYDIR